MKKILLLIMFLCMVSCGKYIDQFKSNTQEDKTFINEVLANRYKNIYKDNEEDLISNIILYQMYLKEKGENYQPFTTPSLKYFLASSYTCSVW